MKTTTQLGTFAADTMLRSAVRYLHRQGVVLTDALIDRLVLALRTASKPALETAVLDAREALAAGMGAAETFALTFALAGIEAARAVLAELVEAN